jgi:hypothetical protein
MGYKNKVGKKSNYKICSFVAVLIFVFSMVQSQSGYADAITDQIPQIPAFLPMAHTVPATQSTPIDGEWMITSIGKRIRIQSGRAYAVDPWVHLFVLKVQPMMVVIKDIVRVKPGEYRGQDLPLMGPWSAQLGPDGTLNVTVAGTFGPVKYALMPISQDDTRAFSREKSGKVSRREKEQEYDDEEYDDEDYDEEEYDEEEYDEEEYDEEEYDDEDYGDEDYDDEDYDDENYDDEDYEDEEAPTKVSAIKRGKAKKGCKGKQIYLSGGSCYACPSGYRRFSPTRKMTHPKACTERGLGNDTARAKYKWESNGCPKGQFKHQGYCKSCPKGTKRMHVAGLDNGYCKYVD